jgi:hypothetical protein
MDSARTTINRRQLPNGISFLVGKANRLPCLECSLQVQGALMDI